MRTERAAFSVALLASGRECLIRDTSGGLQRLCLWAVNTKVSLQATQAFNCELASTHSGLGAGNTDGHSAPALESFTV